MDNTVDSNAMLGAYLARQRTKFTVRATTLEISALTNMVRLAAVTTLALAILIAYIAVVLNSSCTDDIRSGTRWCANETSTGLVLSATSMINSTHLWSVEMSWLVEQPIVMTSLIVSFVLFALAVATLWMWMSLRDRFEVTRTSDERVLLSKPAPERGMDGATAVKVYPRLETNAQV
jgi:hypothetical protein